MSTLALSAEEVIAELRAEVALAIEMLDTIPTDPKLFARRAGTCIPLVRGGLAMVLAKTATHRVGEDGAQ